MDAPSIESSTHSAGEFGDADATAMVSWIEGMVATAVRRSSPFLATVLRVNLINGRVTIVRQEGDDPDDPNEADAVEYAALRGFALTEGQTVMCMNVGKEPVILQAFEEDPGSDKLIYGTTSVVGSLFANDFQGMMYANNLVGPNLVPDALAPAITAKGPASSVAGEIVIYGDTTGKILSRLSGSGWMRAVAGVPGFVTISDGSLLRSSGNDILPATSLADYIKTDAVAQSGSDVGSASSTVNYSTAATLPMALPAGTWTVTAVGGVMLVNPGGSANWRIGIDGDFGTARALTMTVEHPVVDDHLLGGIIGGRTINVVVQFKSNAAGTTSARNPWAIAIAHRTA